MNVGLYFGSFNPIHNGHLIIAKHITNTTSIKQVWLIVSPHNPLKKSSQLLNEYQRLHLAKIATEGETDLRVSNVEFSLPKPSYTIDTLIYLQEKYPTYHFSVIMGSDSFCNIEKWKNYKTLLNSYDLLIYKRPGFEVTETHNAKVTILDAPLIEISSTRIRELIKNKKSFRYLVPDVVKEEIEKNSYYRAGFLQ